MSVCVSVIVPAYNSAATLPRAVGSALKQDMPDMELLIVDDGSRDNTAEVAQCLARSDARVRVVSLPRNRGKSSAMNIAVAEARGAWVAVLDADDWYSPTRLSTLLAAGRREDVDLVADNQYLFDDGAGRIVRTAFPRSLGDRPLDMSRLATGSNPYADFDFGMLKPMVRTEFIRRHGLAYRETAKLSEDFLYLVEFLAAGGRGSLLAEPGYYWRQAFGSISRRWTETGEGSWRYDFLSAARANAELLGTLRSRNRPELCRLLEYRRRAFLRLHVLQEISRARARGATTVRLAREVLAHPTVWPLVFRRSAGHIKRRLPRNLFQRAPDLRETEPR